MDPPKPEFQLPICAQTLIRYPKEEGSTLKEQVSGPDVDGTCWVYGWRTFS